MLNDRWRKSEGSIDKTPVYDDHDGNVGDDDHDDVMIMMMMTRMRVLRESEKQIANWCKKCRKMEH
tara:strand:- start:90 stop:287 length:198 start_codon:yes stop_codon:yes gene_type:complete